MLYTYICSYIQVDYRSAGWHFSGQWIVCSLSHVVLLFNVSGQFCSVLCVCGYCVLDVGFRSVIMCYLMGRWMNVYYAVFALWLFFFSGLTRISCSGLSPNLVLGFYAVIFLWISFGLFPVWYVIIANLVMPRIGQGNVLHFVGDPISPPFLVLVV